ncbi:MAG: SRPBCC family protein [Saprospiraceae bacterium]|nr:SRPBCC family protein [Saprospiraceae bacterium]
MKALKYIGILLLTLIAVFLILGLIAPKKMHLDRSISISADPLQIQDIVSKFSETKNWSPWADLDPNMTVTLEGEDGAINSKYIWSGNNSVGKGSMTLTKNDPAYVEQQLLFECPMGGPAISGIKIASENGGTKATWSFDSETPYPWNAMSLFFNVEKFLGPDYEKGLAKLKTYAEAHASKKYRGYEVKQMDSPGRAYVGVRKTVSFQDVPKFFEDNISKVGQAIGKAGLEMDGMPTGLFYTYDEKTGTTDMVAAMPVKGSPTVTGFETFLIPAGKEVCVDYFGPFEKMGEAHFAIDDYLKEKKLVQSPPAIEQYMTDPMMEKDTSKWLTRIVYPIK